MTKVSFFTLGCRANQAETAVLEDLFLQKGFFCVDGGSPADIVVINSCTVTAQGDKESRRIISRVRCLNPDVRIAVIGCQAQVQKEGLLSRPNVRWVVGTARKMHLADIILEDAGDGKRLVMSPIRRKPFTMPIPVAAGRRVRANLKIQDGCDDFCAYCEVPFARGRVRSRVFENIMEAGRVLVEAGHKEIVLTGINVGLYAYEGRTLPDVIRGLERIGGLARIRLSSVEYAPWISSLAALMRRPHRLCRYLHMPVQSGCDRVLRRMGRLYSCNDVIALLNTFISKVPGVMLGTDVIAGFPGETDGDFCETLDFLEAAPFHYFHVFSYADRHKARSRFFRDPVPPDIIRARSKRLRELGARKRGLFLKGFVGSVLDVLVEQKKEQHWIGRADNYVTIRINSSKNIRNRILSVKVVGVDGEDLKGIMIG